MPDRRLSSRILKGFVPLAALLVATPAVAQRLDGLPPWEPINPTVKGRSNLLFPGFSSHDRGVSVELALDHGSAIESQSDGRFQGSAYLLDAEVSRAAARVTVPVGHRMFVFGDVALGSGSAGFLDAAFDWWHDVFGFDMPEREERPQDSYGYFVRLPATGLVTIPEPGVYLDDTRLGAGWRAAPWLEVRAFATLPTATAEGYGRGVVSAGATGTWRARLGGRVVHEGSAGLGVVPRHGTLAAYQRTVFASASAGGRVRVFGGTSLYANLFLGSPPLQGTGRAGLDGVDYSIDTGLLFATRGGWEYRVALVEDLFPRGSAIDLVVRLGVTRR